MKLLALYPCRQTGYFVKKSGIRPGLLAVLAALQLGGCGSAPPAADAEEGEALAPAAVASVPAATASVPAAPASAPDGAASAPKAGASAPQAAASAPRPARSESQGYAIHWMRPPLRAADDGVQVVTLGWPHGVRFVVTSSEGLGQVEIKPVRGGWPNQVLVEFRHAPEQPFERLEGLRLQVINPAHLAGDQEPPMVPDGFAVWQRGGRLWVTLPPGWLQRQQGLRVVWVDRYRH